MAVGWVLLLSSTLPAQATQGNDTIEQHFELLAETSLGTAVDTTIPIARGFLPGGNTVFDPAPTVTLEVTGRNQGGTGSGGTWNVTLTDGAGASVVTVPFPKASGYQLRTQSFSWPSSDLDLDAIVLHKINQGTNIAGTFDLMKAYLKIHQTGVIKKTAGRVPLGTKETGVSSPSGSRLQAPAVFTYDAAAFDPAPTIRLRATAQGNPCLELYLHDDTVDAQTPPNGVVAGSNLTFSGYRNAESPTLALVGQHTYVLHAAFSTDQSCLPSFDTGHGAAHALPNPSPPGTGDFFSADLILQQSTTDTAGLTKTVGWYPGVTAATDISNNSDLHFIFNAPQANVPNAIEPSWTYTGKLTSPPALGGSIGANAVTNGSLIGSPAHLSTTEFSNPVPSTFTLPSAGADIDTQGFVDNTSTTRGRISLSLLMLKYELHDITGPAVSNFGTPATPTHAFNPTRASIAIVADLCDYSSMNWTITLASVNSHPGLVLPSGSGSGSAVPSSPWNGNCTGKLHVSWTWNGKDASANPVPVPDDDYLATLTPTDGGGVSTTVAPLTLTVDTIDPVVGELTATQPLIGANADAPQNLSTFEDASISGASSWAFTVTQAPNAPVRGVTGTSTSLTVPFNAKTISNVPVPSGSYVGRLVATDLAGNQAIQTKTIEVDNSPPAVTEFAATNLFFSPGTSLGVKDTTTFSANVSDPWGVSWTLDMQDPQGTTVRSFDSSTSTLPVCWDGSSNATPSLCADATHGASVADGTYTPVLTVWDGAHNTNVLNEGVVVVDKTAPSLTAVAPLDHGNTVFTDQRLIAAASDSLSGLVGSSAHTDVTATDGGTDPPSTSTTLSGAQLRTTPLTLAVGRKYLASARIDDEAGNTANLQVRFSVIDLSVPSVTAVIPNTPSSASSSPGPGQVTFTFNDVPVRLPRYTVSIVGETAHPGVGQVGQRIDLSQAVISLYRTVAGSEIPLGDVPAPSSWASAEVFEQLATLAPYSTRGLNVRATQLTDPSLSATLTTIADKAVLHMAAATSSFEPYCADPGNCQANQFPSADPFPFYIGDVAAQSLSERHEALLTALQDEFTRAHTNATEPNTDFGIMYQAYSTSNGFWGGYHYHKHGPAQPDTLPILKYSAGYPVFYPSKLAVDCVQVSCSYQSAQDSGGPLCHLAGYTPWYAPCEQWFTIRAIASMGEVDSQGYVDHTFASAMTSSWGVEDADHDDLGWGHDMQVSLTTVRKYAYRSYLQSIADSDGSGYCSDYRVTGDGAPVSGPDEAWIVSSHGTAFEEGTLKQKNGSAPCGTQHGNWQVPKRLGFAYVSHTENAKYVDTGGLLIGDYGHSYEQNSTSWSCGAMTDGAGCSFSVEDSVHSWLAQDLENFHY